MIRKIYIILVLLALLVVTGCSSAPATVTATQPSDIKIVRQTEIATEWAVKQIEINLQSSTSILLKLAPGDSVDGYFYLVKGNDVDFQISGKSQIYASMPAGASENITSDRFSFTASDAQGIAYTLKVVRGDAANNKKTDTTVFMEIIYPVTGEIFDPMGTK